MKNNPKPEVLSLSDEFSFSRRPPVFCLEGQHLPGSKKHESQALRQARWVECIYRWPSEALCFSLCSNSPLGLFKWETIQQERRLHRGGLQTVSWLPCFPPPHPTPPAPLLKSGAALSGKSGSRREPATQVGNCFWK